MEEVDRQLEVPSVFKAFQDKVISFEQDDQAEFVEYEPEVPEEVSEGVGGGKKKVVNMEEVVSEVEDGLRAFPAVSVSVII